MENEGDLNETLILLVLEQVPEVGDPEERGVRWGWRVGRFQSHLCGSFTMGW